MHYPIQKLTKGTTVLALVISGLLTACGGGTGGSTGGTTPGGTTPGGTSNAGLRAKFAACPIANMSSDPAAGTCLAGTYTLNTLDSKACTLTVRADGSYDFASPALTYSYTPKADSFRLYNHASPAADNHQVLWSMNDAITTGTEYNLSLEARFGSYLGASDQYLEVKAERIDAGGAHTNVTCKTTL